MPDLRDLSNEELRKLVAGGDEAARVELQRRRAAALGRFLREQYRDRPPG